MFSILISLFPLIVGFFFFCYFFKPVIFFLPRFFESNLLIVIQSMCSFCVPPWNTNIIPMKENAVPCADLFCWTKNIHGLLWRLMTWIHVSSRFSFRDIFRDTPLVREILYNIAKLPCCLSQSINSAILFPFCFLFFLLFLFIIYGWRFLYFSLIISLFFTFSSFNFFLYETVFLSFFLLHLFFQVWRKDFPL